MVVLTTDRLNQLSCIPCLHSIWHCVIATTLCACNRSEEIPVLIKYALDQHQDSPEAQHEMISQVREAIFKVASIVGIARATNAFFYLQSITPLSMQQTAPLRDYSRLPSTEKGTRFLETIYGSEHKQASKQIEAASPEMELWALTYVFSFVVAFEKILPFKESSLLLVAVLIPDNVRQLPTYLQGCLNHGASVEEVRAVRATAIEICKWSDISWRTPIPDI